MLLFTGMATCSWNEVFRYSQHGSPNVQYVIYLNRTQHQSVMPNCWYCCLQEWRHAHGMRCLGIPNTAHFANVTLIEDALSCKSIIANYLFTSFQLTLKGLRTFYTTQNTNVHRFTFNLLMFKCNYGRKLPLKYYYAWCTEWAHSFV